LLRKVANFSHGNAVSGTTLLQHWIVLPALTTREAVWWTGKPAFVKLSSLPATSSRMTSLRSSQDTRSPPFRQRARKATASRKPNNLFCLLWTAGFEKRRDFSAGVAARR